MTHEAIAKEDFEVLAREIHAYAQSRSWRQIHGVELLKFGLRAALFVLGYLTSRRSLFLGLPAMAYAYYGIAITGVHESSHNAFVRSAWANRLWSYFFSDFWAGQSSDWWHHRHVVLHHAHTNVVEVDPPLFTFPWIDKHLYFFAVPFLVGPWMIQHSVLHLRRHAGRLALFLALCAAGWGFHVWLFARLMPAGRACLAAFAMRALFAPVFMHLAVFNHSGLGAFSSRGPWLPHQTRTTRNLAPHWFLSGMGGNAFVECHLEHHLFPYLSNHLLSRIRPLVRRRLESAGYAYLEQGYWDCLKDNLAHYEAYSAPQPA